MEWNEGLGSPGCPGYPGASMAGLWLLSTWCDPWSDHVMSLAYDFPIEKKNKKNIREPKLSRTNPT